MKKQIAFSISLYMLLLSACKDDLVNPNDDATYTISGHLYNDCGLQPVSNFKLLLLQGGAYNPLTGETTGGELGTTMTDSLGFFKFEFKDKKGYENVIKYSAGVGYNDIMTEIPVKKSIDNLILYKNPTTNIQLLLNVTNPHQLGDTLHITDFNSAQDYLVLCPLSSGILYTATSVPLPVMHYNGEQSRIIWWFNNYNGIYSQQDFTINKYCYDTIFVTANIN